MTLRTDQPKRVLVADDDLTFRVLIEQTLIDCGLEVECVGDGNEAERRILDCPPDLVLLDNVMPGRPGTAVCKDLHEKLNGACPPIVMVTGCDGESEIEEAFAAGAIDYLVKPVNWTLLKFQLANWIGAAPRKTEVTSSARRQPLELLVSGRGRILELISHGHLPVDGEQPRSVGDLMDSIAFDRTIALLRRALRTRVSQSESFEASLGERSAIWTMNFDVRGRDKVNLTIFESADSQNNQAQLYRLAYVDSATGLPNHHLFTQTLNDRLNIARFQRRGLAVVCLTIETGRDAGNAASKFLERLAATGRTINMLWSDEREIAQFELPDDSVSRLAAYDGRYLLALVENNATRSQIDEKLDRIQASDDGTSHLRAGIALFPGDGDSAEILLDTALAAAGGSARSSAANRGSSVASSDLEAELLDALRDDRLEVYYQPRVDLGSGQVIASEALVRWNHPIFGQMNGAQLFDRLQGGCSTRELADWSMRRACEQASEWQRQGLSSSVTLNVADAQLVDDSFADTLLAMLAELGLPPKLVELEIAAASAETLRQTEGQLMELCAAGLGLIIDDFGTEKVQLEQLSRLSPKAFKIDWRRLQDEDANFLSIARAIAESCGAQLIAKHIETSDQLDAAREASCEEAQGYRICQPLANSELLEYCAALALSETSSLELTAST